MSDYAPYAIGLRIAPQEGRRLYGYFATCPGGSHVNWATSRPFSTRALQAADGTELTAEVCSDCGRIKQLQAT